MNKKVGFDWYKVETDRYNDVRIRRLVTNCSTKGLAVYDYLLTSIYRDRGCYIVCNDDCIFSVAEFLNMTESAVKEIISYCGSVGLFHDEFLLRDSNGALLSRGGVITSKAIQRRYVEMCETVKRKVFVMPADYILISDMLSNEGKYRRIEENFQNVGNLSQNAGILPKNAGNISEKFCVNLALYSIVKYNKYNCITLEKEKGKEKPLKGEKEKEREKDKTIGVDENSTTISKPLLSASEKRIKEVEARKAREQKFYEELIPFVDKYGKEMIREFYDYWTQTNSDNDTTNLMDIEKRKKGKFCISLRLATWKKNKDDREARNSSSPSPSCRAAVGTARESYSQIEELISQVIS